MKEYLLSVVAVSLLIILLEIFMSEGNTKKYTQGIIRLILIIVIITPVIKVFSNGIDISDFNVNVDTQQEILIDKTFIQDVVEQRNQAKRNKKERQLSAFPSLFVLCLLLTLYYLCTRPLPPPLIRLSTSLTETRL